MVSEKWQLGSYTFTINPNKYGEGYTYVGDNAVSLDGTVISMPTTIQEQYNFSSTLYQGNPKLISQVSMPNAVGVKLLSGNYYVANNSTKKIDQYNSNFGLIKSYNTGAGSGNNLLALDIAPNGTLYALEDLVGGQYLHTITSTTGNTSKTVTNMSNKIEGIKYDNGNLWMVDTSGVLFQTDMNFNINMQVTLPYIDPQYIGYRGMEIVGNYLVVTFNNSDINGAYHIDRTTGIIANAFGVPTNPKVYDVTYDGQNFVFLTSNNQLIYTNGNTLLADIYTIESNIRNNGYLYMTDDMGVQKKVAVANYTIDRMDGYLTMYDIQLTVTKIDRG
jgi:hypothetical protein